MYLVRYGGPRGVEGAEEKRESELLTPSKINNNNNSTSSSSSSNNNNNKQLIDNKLLCNRLQSVLLNAIGVNLHLRLHLHSHLHIHNKI